MHRHLHTLLMVHGSHVEADSSVLSWLTETDHLVKMAVESLTTPCLTFAKKKMDILGKGEGEQLERKPEKSHKKWEEQGGRFVL